MKNKGALLRLFILAVSLLTTIDTARAQAQFSDSSNELPDCLAPVMIYGAVASPHRFDLQRRLRLRELIALAGGVTARASGRIEILHTQSSEHCEDSATSELDELIGNTETYKLADVLSNDERANLYLRAGDLVMVSEIATVQVFGGVANPRRIDYIKGLTVSQAVEQAGGLSPDARKDRIYIHRRTEEERFATAVNLDAIMKHRSADTVLLPDDIVEVSRKESEGPSIFVSGCTFW